MRVARTEGIVRDVASPTTLVDSTVSLAQCCETSKEVACVHWRNDK